MKILATFLASILCAVTAAAQPDAVRLFHTGDSTGHLYRIPAIATACNGDIIALSDCRPCGHDIGFGRVDIMARISGDNGATWGEAATILAGSGHGYDCGFGDACIVADRDHSELLVICVSGDIPYQQSTYDHHQRVVSTRAHYDSEACKWLWDSLPPADLTDQIYDDILLGRIDGLFMASGRICQSRLIKVGDYFRIYGGLCTHRGNFVIYSDDFGRNWRILGDPTASCVPLGDEPKCEELPDGSLVISSRKAAGRFFNIFRYSDPVEGIGTWGEAVDSATVPGGISNESTPCNGEILVVPALRRDGTPTFVALQSMPAGPLRANVTIYYKELATAADYATSLAFASDWQGRFQVSTLPSAYSAMALQHDGRIGFFYEEEPGNYQMVYRPLDLSTITENRYTIATTPKD